MKTTLIAFSSLLGVLFLTSAINASGADGDFTNRAPVIQFENTFFDFGKIPALGKVSGSFKFKNAGNAVLKLDPPKPSCGCTDAKATPDTLAPGQSGEITYTINLDHATGQVQKHISIYSNDPKSPDVQLTMQLDCTPLYEANPKMLRLVLPPGKDEVEGVVTVTRNDGAPSTIERLVSTHKSVDAELDSSAVTEVNVAKVKVTVHRPAEPTAKVLANIQMWASEETNRPMITLLAWCDVQGELTVSPTQMYWVMPNLGGSITNYPADVLTHTLRMRATLGQPVKIKSVTTNIKGMTAEAVSKGDGKDYDLVLKFNELPHQYVTGNVTVETSSDTLPKLEVPVTVAAAP